MPVLPPRHNLLLNRSILVACSAKKMSTLSDGLRALGASVTPFPVIEIREIEDKVQMDNALDSLERYDWIIFTSAYGATYFSQRFHERKIQSNVLKELKICAIGPATESTLKELGFKVDMVPTRFVAEGVVEALETCYGGLGGITGSRILIPRAKFARDVLPDTLTAAGAGVDIVPFYQTVKATLDKKTILQLKAETPDLIVFTSSSTVKNMVEIMGHTAGKNLLRKSTVAAIGPITVNTVESFGKHVEIVPKQSTIVSLIQAIEDYYSGQ